MLQFRKIIDQKDIDILVELIQIIWPEVFYPISGKKMIDYLLVHYQGKDAIIKEMENGRQYFFIEVDGQPIGYLAYNIEEDRLYISKVYLLKEYRGKGLSNQVFDHFEEVARSNGKQKLFLRVNRGNKQAIEVYLHRGFEIVDSIDEPFGDFVLNDYCMHKPL